MVKYPYPLYVDSLKVSLRLCDEESLFLQCFHELMLRCLLTSMCSTLSVLQACCAERGEVRTEGKH